MQSNRGPQRDGGGRGLITQFFLQPTNQLMEGTVNIKPGFYLHLNGVLFDYFPLDKEAEARKAAEAYARNCRMMVGVLKVESAGEVQPAELPVKWS